MTWAEVKKRKVLVAAEDILMVMEVFETEARKCRRICK